MGESFISQLLIQIKEGNLPYLGGFTPVPYPVKILNLLLLWVKSICTNANAHDNCSLALKK